MKLQTRCFLTPQNIYVISFLKENQLKLPAPLDRLPTLSPVISQAGWVSARWEDRCLRNWQDHQAAPGGPWQPICTLPSTAHMAQHMCRDAHPPELGDRVWEVPPTYPQRRGRGLCMSQSGPWSLSCGHFMSKPGFPRLSGEDCVDIPGCWGRDCR